MYLSNTVVTVRRLRRNDPLSEIYRQLPRVFDPRELFLCDLQPLGLTADGTELFVLVRQVLRLCGAHKGKVWEIKRRSTCPEYSPLTRMNNRFR